MQKFVKMLSDSCRELKKAQVLAAAAMFAALALYPKLCGLYPDRPLYQDRIFQYSQPAGGFPLRPCDRRPLRRYSGYRQVLPEAGRRLLPRLHLQCHPGRCDLRLLLL